MDGTKEYHPFIQRMLLMSETECAALTQSQRAALAARAAELLEQGYELPPIPNLQKTARKRCDKSSGSVYFLHSRAANLVKIGFATNVRSRVSAIRAMSPVPLVLVRTIDGCTKR